jgi:hypothetical protein
MVSLPFIHNIQTENYNSIFESIHFRIDFYVLSVGIIRKSEHSIDGKFYDLELLIWA